MVLQWRCAAHADCTNEFATDDDRHSPAAGTAPGNPNMKSYPRGKDADVSILKSVSVAAYWARLKSSLSWLGALTSL
jgi:hypothetical protein